MYGRATGPHGFVHVESQSLVYFVRSWLFPVRLRVPRTSARPAKKKLNYNYFFFCCAPDIKRITEEATLEKRAVHLCDLNYVRCVDLQDSLKNSSLP